MANCLNSACGVKGGLTLLLTDRYMCPSCAELNWAKRHLTRDLSGRVALVTGGRVKIGFEICLKLLRAGCRLIMTTRFPKAREEPL